MRTAAFACVQMLNSVIVRVSSGQGYLSVAEVMGGFPAWTAAFRPNGEPRAASGGWMSADGREELFGTGG